MSVDIQLTAEQIATLKELDHIHVSWRDYALMLLNSTNNNCGLRDVWHEKVLTSYFHWLAKDGSISEANVFGLEVLSELPSQLTLQVVDDWYDHEGIGSWQKMGRLAGSKRMKLHVGGYPQESLSNEAYLCLQWLTQHLDEPLPDEWLYDMLKKIHGVNWEHFVPHAPATIKDVLHLSPTLNRLLKLASMSGGKSVSQDEVLTWLLERPLVDTEHGSWMMTQVVVSMYGIPSEQYGKWWKSKAIEGFPLNGSESSEQTVKEHFMRAQKLLVGEGVAQNPLEAWESIKAGLDAYESTLPFEQQLETMLNFVRNGMLREDVAYCCCWKKIAICVLKGDSQFKYAGFGATMRERIAREEAMAAFSVNQAEKEQAKKNAQAMAKEIEERRKNGE